MRHRLNDNRLGRFSSLRKATVRDLAKATLKHQRICTTRVKAKYARRLVEQLITLGKQDTLAAKRRAFAILCDHGLVSDLFGKIAGRFKSRLGGYTRIIPLSERRGDNAHLVFLELTEKEIIVAPPKTAKAVKETHAHDHKHDHAHPHVHKAEAKQAKTEDKTHTHEEKKEQPPKKQPMSAPPAKGAHIKDKGKSRDVMGGFKRFFTKKPPSE